MKKTLLFIFLLGSTGMFAQVYNSGEIQLLTNLTADISINGFTSETTVTLTAPDNVWFAIGFGGLNMSSGADVLRTDGTTIVDARSTGRFLPSADASQDWVLESNTTSGGVRTLVVSRANNTGDPDDYIFNEAEGAIQLIYAHGTSSTYAYHGGANRGFTTIGVLLSNDDTTQLDFTIRPNPAEESTLIDIPSFNGDATVQIFDSMGRLTMTQTVDSFNNSIDVSEINSGIYIVKVSTRNSVGTQKLIKQ